MQVNAESSNADDGAARIVGERREMPDDEESSFQMI